MKEDRLLNELGDLARQADEAEKAHFDERWDRLAAGTLSPEEDAELRALASASPDFRETYEAFRPLGPDFQARMVAAATAELAPRPAPEQTRPRLLPFRPAAARVEVWLGAAASIAAVLFLFLHSPNAPLPVYKADLISGVQSQRGEPALPESLPVFVPGSLLTVNVRPLKPVEGPVEARGFVSPPHRNEDLSPLEPAPRFDIGDNGSVRLSGTLGREIQLPPGDWTIWIVVGRPGKIPSTEELAGRLTAIKAHSDWQAVPADLRVDDRAPP